MLAIVLRGKAPRPDDAPEVPLHQRDPGALHRDVGARPHGDPHLRLRERRGVVDAVACHRDDAPLRLEPLHDLRLLIGQHLGHDLVDRELPRDRFGGRSAVAREHDDAEALTV